MRRQKSWPCLGLDALYDLGHVFTTLLILPASPELKITVGEPPEPGRGGATGGGGGGIGVEDSSLVRQGGGGGGGGGAGGGGAGKGPLDTLKTKKKSKSTFSLDKVTTKHLFKLTLTCAWDWWGRRWRGRCWHSRSSSHAWSHTVIAYSLRAARMCKQSVSNMKVPAPHLLCVRLTWGTG